MSFKYAESNRNLSVTLTGICITILTFSLFFVYAGVLAERYNSILFQVALATIVVALFCFTLAGATYFAVLGLAAAARPEAATYDRRAYILFFTGVILLAIEPTMILFTVNLPWVGVLALGLWVLLIFAMLKVAHVWRPFE